MTAYAVAHLHDVELGPAIVAYLRAIDATLAPFGGRYAIHGGRAEVLEGTWTGDLIMIAFPDLERARAWYGSEAYRRILPLRTDHARGPVILIDGVGAGHRAADILGDHIPGADLGAWSPESEPHADAVDDGDREEDRPGDQEAPGLVREAGVEVLEPGGHAHQKQEQGGEDAGDTGLDNAVDHGRSIRGL
jgi:uncharacterized protein (DUF1330 family)